MDPGQLAENVSLTERLRSLLPNRDVAAALSGEWLAMPVAPSLLQGQACQSSHEVELSGPSIAVWGRELLELAVD